MAVKAIAWLDHFQIENDNTYYVAICVRAGANGADTVFVGPFDGSESKLAINTALRQAAQDYAEEEWSVTFTPIIDSTLLLTGVDLL